MGKWKRRLEKISMASVDNISEKKAQSEGWRINNHLNDLMENEIICPLRMVRNVLTVIM
jgi:hypothetical protein